MAPITSIFAAFVAISCFEGIFANGQSLASKWDFEDPTHVFIDETNTFTLTYAVDDSITQANTISAVYEKGCLEEGNELFAADGIVDIKTAVDTTGQATLSFYFNLIILKENSKIFTEIAEEARAEMQVCARFMLQTDDGSIEVNYLESVITIIFNLEAGFELEGFVVTTKEKKDDLDNFSKAYDIVAYLCDPRFPETELTGTFFSQGGMISVCVTPAQAAIDEGLLMKSIDTFSWARDFIEQPAIAAGVTASNQLTSMTCPELSLYCSFSSVLYATFYRPPTLAPSSSPSAIQTDIPTYSPIASADIPSYSPIAPASVSPTVYVDQTICEETVQNVETSLDFFQSTIKQSDIHTGGELRYGNIGTINGQEVDLLVTANNDYSQPDYNGSGKTKSGTFGELSVKPKINDPTAGVGIFQFCFVQPDTNTQVMASSFQWSVFDLDNRAGQYPIHEKLTIDTTQVQSYSLWPNEDETEIAQYCENDGSELPCEEGARTVFEGTTQGGGTDNPSNPNSLTDQQKKRSIVFTFTNIACWTAEFALYCPVEPELECTIYQGGRLTFSGSADEVTQGGTTTCSQTTTTTTARRNLGGKSSNTEVGVRNLAAAEPAEVGGRGTATLAFGKTRRRGRRRRLSDDGLRLLQDEGPKADIALTVAVITADDDISRLATAGGANAARGSFFSTMVVLIISGIVVFVFPFLSM